MACYRVNFTFTLPLQAVEAALLELHMVNTSCVVAEGDEGTDKFLVAYIVPEGETSQQEVRAALKKRLPLYMIPSRFVFIERQVT
jgi:acyl-CoA synthetase (AMP-forming)/AMP-acid ligase II